jgi:hypothetical protein
MALAGHLLAACLGAAASSAERATLMVTCGSTSAWKSDAHVVQAERLDRTVEQDLDGARWRSRLR